jgi:nitrite reductase/ring-hydroxylating ferredoxin subunit
MGRTLVDFAGGRLRAYVPGGFEFVAARDIVEGHVLAMEKGRAGQRYIFSTEFLTVDQLLGLFEAATGRPRPRLRLPPALMAGIAEVKTWVMDRVRSTAEPRFTPGAVRFLRMRRRADCGKAKGRAGLPADHHRPGGTRRLRLLRPARRDHAVTPPMDGRAPAAASPPSFASAANRRQRRGRPGLDPNYWYPVEYDRAVRPGQVVEVVFWNTSLALYRGSDGELRVLENRCAHRQLPLTLGEVDGCHLACAYHGWTYDGQGRLVGIPHDLFGRPMPSLAIGSYPVKVRYGLIWVFPGDPARARERSIPDIPELEGESGGRARPSTSRGAPTTRSSSTT